MNHSIAKLSALVLVFALVVGLAAGCGGDSDSDASTPTKAEFIRQADALCEQADAKQEKDLQSYASKSSKDFSSQAVQENVITVVGMPPIQEQAEKIGKLEVPDGDEDEVRAIVDGIEAAVAKVEADPLSMTREGDSPFTEADKLARTYGLKACADSA